MPGEEAIECEGRIVEVLSNRLFRVELANGHRLLGHLAGRARLNLVRTSLGDTVRVRLSPYDLTTGRIIFKETKET